MNRILFLAAGIASALAVSCVTRTTNYPFGTGEVPAVVTAALFDPLASLYPDTVISSGSSVFVTDIPNNAAGSVVVMVGVRDRDEVFNIEITGPGAEQIEFSELQEISVLENTGYFGMTEKNLGFDNRHVVRHAPFSIYEVLRPSSPGNFAGKNTYAFHLKRRIDVGEKYGSIETFIIIRDSSGKAVQSLKWVLNVHPVLLLEGEDVELRYTNWFRGPRTGYMEKFDEDWWGVMDSHIAFMREGGQNTVLIPRDVVFDNVDEDPVLNPERLQRFMSLAESHGMFLFEGPRPAFRKSTFLKKGVVIKPGPYDTFTPQAAAALECAYRPLYEFLAARGSVENWIQHVLDEPLSKHAKDYQWVAAVIREAMPGVRIVDATKTRKPLAGAVDIWSPLVSDYQINRSFFTDRQTLGEEVWIYACMVPGGAWLNRTMDQERLRSVYVGWGSALFGVTGYLRWDLDKWREDQDIWNGELSGSEDDLIRRPFGDGFVTFPGENGTLLSTTRWEACRIGMEDYRLLMMLKAKDEAAFQDIVAMCFTDFKTYSTDPAVYRAARRRLLSELEGNS